MVRGRSHNRGSRRAGAIALGTALLAALSAPSALLAQDAGAGLAEGGSANAAGVLEDASPPTDSKAAPPPEASIPPPESDPASPVSSDEEAPTPTPLAVAAGAGGVTMADFSFSPATITVSVGETVTWTNAGPDEAHTATGDGFDTGTVAVGASGSATFDSPGSFSYVCSLHPDLMSGTVVVETAGGGGTGGGSDAGDSAPAASEASEAAAIAAPDAAGTASKLPATGFVALPMAVVGLALVVGGRKLRGRISG